MLLDNDHKVGWDKCDDGYLIWMLSDNLIKLSELTCQESKDLQKVIKEAVDIANYAMMIADNAMRGSEVAENVQMSRVQRTSLHLPKL